VVLYYKASHTDLGVLIQEEVEEEEEEIKKDSKQDSCHELVSVPSEPAEIKSAKAEEGCYEESQEQEGKEDDNKDESASDTCPEASEGNNPLKLSESKKVTAVEGRTEWEVGSGAPVPWCGGVTQPEDGLLQERIGQPALRPSVRGEWRWSQEWWKWALHRKWRAETTLLWTYLCLKDHLFWEPGWGRCSPACFHLCGSPRSLRQEVFPPSPSTALRTRMV